MRNRSDPGPALRSQRHWNEGQRDSELEVNERQQEGRRKTSGTEYYLKKAFFCQDGGW